VKKRLLLSIVLSLAAGVIIGAYGGFRLGKSPVLNNALQKNAKDVQAHVAALKHVREGRADKALEVIEADLDDDLVLFDPWESYGPVNDQTNAEIRKAIGQARDYRAAYPRKSNRPHVDAMVGSVLKKEAFK
jgi:hypothetical protein